MNQFLELESVNDGLLYLTGPPFISGEFYQLKIKDLRKCYPDIIPYRDTMQILENEMRAAGKQTTGFFFTIRGGNFSLLDGYDWVKVAENLGYDYLYGWYLSYDRLGGRYEHNHDHIPMLAYAAVVHGEPGLLSNVDLPHRMNSKN